MPVDVPCGRCVGCRLEKARIWAVRCMHEAMLHERNCFLTLTYSEENLPPGGSLRPRDMVLFLKRLRERVPQEIRFFQCGEYGEKLGRPHHHVLVFGYDFPDRVRLSGSGSETLWESELLSELWPFGFHSIGEVTFESAGYVARYQVKKVYGAEAEKHYQGKVPEYVTMSRRPGLGAGWIEKYGSDVFPSGELVVNGVKTKAPRYYEDRHARSKPEEVAWVKLQREQAAKDDPERSGKRLVVREKVKLAQTKLLTRGYER